MSRKFLLITLAVLALAFQATAATEALDPASINLNQDRPLFFTENKGQWDERVLFKADGTGGLTWFIEQDGFTILFSVPDENSEEQQIERIKQIPDPLQSAESAVNYKGHALKFKFQNALPRTAGNFLPEQTTPASAASVEPSDRLSWNNNYFLGNDKSKWAPDCGNFQRVALKDVWPGVDVVWRGSINSGLNGLSGTDASPESALSAASAVNMIEFDFLVHPNADPNAIRIECLGLTGEMESSSNGEELLLPTSLGVLRQSLPEAFQIEKDGSLAPVRAEFTVADGKSFGVALPEGFDKTKPLIVDPLVYSTYLGGNRWDETFAITPDGEGGVVVAGYTQSDNFPTTEGAFQENYGGGEWDAFSLRMNADGSALIYSTHLGGNRVDAARALTPDGAGGGVVSGETQSQNFPTTDGAYQRNLAGPRDAFIVQLNSEGSALIYSTLLGGNDSEFAFALTSDGAGGVVVGGLTNGNLPTTEGAFQRNYGGGQTDGFVARLSLDGNGDDDLLYSTYLGGSGEEGSNYWYFALTSDGEGGVVAAGITTSEDFPTTEGAYQRNYGGRGDAFITRLNSEGSELIYSTYLGGNTADIAIALTPDGVGGAVVAGFTYSNDFPTTEWAYQRNYGGGDCDAFITHLNDEGSELIYSTYLGGGSGDYCLAITPDGAGGVVVSGETQSRNFPITEEAYQRNSGGSYDAFVTDIDIGLPSFRWVEMPDEVEVDENDLVEFDVRGESSDENAELSITYLSDDLPVFARFVDNGDGSGTFTWQTTDDDIGEYTAVFTLSDGENELEAEVSIIVLGPLRWTDVLDAVEFNERERGEFNVRGESINGNADLSIRFRSDDLPDSARFVDNGNGNGTFTWQTDYYSAGEYTAIFTLSDGDNQLEKDIAIRVNNVNGPPEWVEMPDTVSAMESRELVFNVSGRDPDGGSLSIRAFSENIRQGLQFTDNGDGTGTFAWTPGLGRAGNYSATFILSDADTSVEAVVHIIVLRYSSVFDPGLSIPDHFYLSTNFPNPFNAVTRLSFGLPKASQVSVRVFDVTGREVATVVSGNLEAGTHTALWNAEAFTSGIYLVKMEAGNFSDTRKVMLIR